MAGSVAGTLTSRSMRAVLVRRFGEPDCLEVDDAPMPVPQPDEVLVRVRAVGLNHSDLLQRAGRYVGGPVPPFVPGVEGSGEVGVSGDRVAFLSRGGACAEWLAVRRDALLPLPSTISFEAGASLPVAYLTAYHAIVTVLKARPGQTILILGAAGGVGTAAVGIARHLGLHVIGVASTETRRARLAAMGAATVLSYDQIARSRPDMILDTVGGRPLRQGLGRLPPFGRAVVVGAAGSDGLALDPILLVYRSLSVSGLHLDAIVSQPDMVREATEHVLAWISAGSVAVEIDDVLPFTRVAEAHRRLAARQVFGKLVLVPDRAH